MKLGVALATLLGVLIFAVGDSLARDGGEGAQTSELISVRDVGEDFYASSAGLHGQAYNENKLGPSAFFPRISVGSSEPRSAIHPVRSKSTCPSANSIYPISPAKINVIKRIERRVCQVTYNNEFGKIKELLKRAGDHIGEEITLEEAYPYIYCGNDDLDLLHVIVGAPWSIGLSGLELIDYLSQEVCDRTLLQKIVGCKRDIGLGCLNVLEHMKKLISDFDLPGSTVEDYNDLSRWLGAKLEESGGVIRDVEFCQKVLSEPYYCSLE